MFKLLENIDNFVESFFIDKPIRIKRSLYNIKIICISFLSKKNAIISIKNNVITIIYLFIYLFLFYLFIKNIKIIQIKMLTKYIFVMGLVYTTYSTFVFLSNSVKYSKYTSFNQRFWKITYTSFWLIEFFLFFLFTYLTLIAPNENIITIDTKKNFFIFSWSSYFFIINLLLLGSLIFIQIFLITNKSTLKRIHISILLLMSLFLLYMYFYIEFLKFLNSINYFKYKRTLSDLNFKPQSKKRYKHLKFSQIKEFTKKISPVTKNRTVDFFLFLLIWLKFWHVFFIFLFYTFSIKKFIENKVYSFDIISANMQNFIYLLFFHFYFFLLLFKKYFYYYIIIYFYIYNYNFNINLFINEFINTLKSFT